MSKMMTYLAHDGEARGEATVDAGYHGLGARRDHGHCQLQWVLRVRSAHEAQTMEARGETSVLGHRPLQPTVRVRRGRWQRTVRQLPPRLRHQIRRAVVHANLNEEKAAQLGGQR